MSKRGIMLVTQLLSSLIFVAIGYLLKLWKIGIEMTIVIGILLSLFYVLSLNYIYKKYKIVGYDDSQHIQVDFHSVSDVADHAFKYAVIMSQYKGKWIFVRHKERTTWEIPGGRREVNEDILKTAERELMEETGASQFHLTPMTAYSVKRDSERTYGLLCYAEILAFDNPLTMEIVEIKEFEELPTELTYPFIQAKIFNYMKLVELPYGGFQ